MNGFTQHSGIAVPLIQDNVDTDQIIPSREMKRVSKHGLAEGLFAGQRYLYDGSTRTGVNHAFPLNAPDYQSATILLSGSNFGCGSSREHAVWALREYGFVAVIAESFGEIFRNNALRNGLLPIQLSDTEIAQLNAVTSQAPATTKILIDLQHCEVSVPNQPAQRFQLENYYREMLLNGWDFIDLAERNSVGLDQFIISDSKARPWAYLQDDSKSQA